MADENIIRKIEALLAKANSTTSEAEAAAFAAKAAELLSKYNLEMDDIVRKDEQVIAKDDTWAVPTSMWSVLAQNIGKLYFCDLIVLDKIHTAKSGYQRIIKVHKWIGRENNVEVASSMFDYLRRTVQRLARDYHPSPSEQNNFLKGAVLNLVKRVKDILNETKQNSGSGNALVVLYNEEETRNRNFIRDNFVTRNTKARTNYRDGEAFRDGAVAGSKISLNNQVSGQKSGFLLGSR